jgi:hypothetical protein
MKFRKLKIKIEPLKIWSAPAELGGNGAFLSFSHGGHAISKRRRATLAAAVQKLALRPPLSGTCPSVPRCSPLLNFRFQNFRLYLPPAAKFPYLQNETAFLP